MLRTILIKKYVNAKDIQWIIGHSPVVYLKEAIIMIVFLFLLFVIKAVLVQFYFSPELEPSYLKRIFGIVGVLLFLKWMFDFLNLYLDCLILSKDNAILFLWE